MSNRSSGRRRRGGRPSTSRGPSDGNRQTHRNSGNAHQLLDKYKNLARDSHQQGDRVLNEYYLQFADHYFRVLAESNDRKDEHKRGRDDSRKPQDDDRQASAPAKEHAAPKSSPPKSSPSKGDENASGSTGRSSSSKKSGDSAKEGDDLKISADVLPGAVPVDSAESEMNGKSSAKKSTSPRSKPKPADGDGASAEA